jgi:type I restriction enzyme S subunit
MPKKSSGTIMSLRLWPKETIGGLFDIGAGKAMSPSARLGERTYPFLRTANVFWGEVDLSKLDTMNFSEDEIEFKSLKKGDLLVCEGGDIGRSAVWHGQIAKCGFQNHIHRLRPKSTETVPAFFMYYLQAGFTQLGIYEGAGNKTTIPNLSRGRLAILEVPNPPKLEQAKIASVLWKVQHAIQLEEKLKSAANELKQSAMQKIFVEGLRKEPLKETVIGQMPKGWNPTILRDLSVSSAFGPRFSSDKYSSAGRVVTLRTTDIDGDGIIDFSKAPPADMDPDDWRNHLLQANDCVVTRSGTCGIVAVFEGHPKPVLPGAFLIRVRLNERLLSQFFRYVANSMNGRQRMEQLAQGAIQKNISSTRLLTYLVPLPPIDEQREIVTMLQTIDRKISVHERKRAALSDLFQTLLHQLMTAQIRVDKLDIDTLEISALC